MPVSEFDIITRYFASQIVKREDVVLGIGDDCALVNPDPQSSHHELLALTMDSLVAGVHFPDTTSPYDIGYKALAVNLSDLAAMGATPKWMTLALTMPESNEEWLHEFSHGLFDLANKYDVALIGGDITRGPLTITIQAHGGVPRDLVLTRNGAKPGDVIVISGTLGDAALGLMQTKEHLPMFEVNEIEAHYFEQRLNRPQPRIALGQQIRDIASAAIDISDGFAADLQHILDASQCGASIDIDKLPLSAEAGSLSGLVNLPELALNGGDDYELCFTVPPDRLNTCHKLAQHSECRLTEVGTIETETGLRIRRGQVDIPLNTAGYRHF